MKCGNGKWEKSEMWKWNMGNNTWKMKNGKWKMRNIFLALIQVLIDLVDSFMDYRNQPKFYDFPSLPPPQLNSKFNFLFCLKNFSL
jgi:hypothetical protein